MEQLHGLIVKVNQTRDEQAKVKGASNVGMDSVQTPWLKHLLKTFINEHQSSHSKGKDFTNNRFHDVQREQVPDRGGKKGRGLATTRLPFLQLDWNDDLESEEASGSNMHYMGQEWKGK